ncbi:hypothetical protein D3C75_991790 [compost metagenome]
MSIPWKLPILIAVRWKKHWNPVNSRAGLKRFHLFGTRLMQKTVTVFGIAEANQVAANAGQNSRFIASGLQPDRSLPFILSFVSCN